jgi:superfamily II DNA/RNA helicase
MKNLCAFFVPQDYIHRVGRTARAGRGGHSLSLVTQVMLKDLYRKCRRKKKTVLCVFVRRGIVWIVSIVTDGVLDIK